MVDPGTIILTLKIIAFAVTTLHNAVNKALQTEHNEREALKDLLKAIGSLKSDIEVYKILLNAMEDDPNLDPKESSAYRRFIQRWVAEFYIRTQLMLHNVADRTQGTQWKASRARSITPNDCSRNSQ